MTAPLSLKGSSAQAAEESALSVRVQMTQKEVRDVCQKAESVAELPLRRLMSQWGERGEPQQVLPLGPSLNRVKGLKVLREHEGIALHAASLQLETYSAGRLQQAGGMRPLWLGLLLEGNGLRRMTSEIFQHATRAVRLLGVEDLEAVSHSFVRDAWKAYLLGLNPLALELLSQGRCPSERQAELRVRVQLAMGDFSSIDETPENAFPDFTPRKRISLCAASIAYVLRRGGSAATSKVDELAAWVSEVRRKSVPVGDELLFAQVVNALNLAYLPLGKIDAVEEQMDYLLRRVIPQIADSAQRDHVEGNAYYQLSILARNRGDRSGEIFNLLAAMERDRHFTTLYYRMAQVFHDQGDARAESFYEMALALSPLDFPTANDYGCFLAEAGQEEKLTSWSSVCRVLFPEQFSASPEDQA